MEKFNQLKAAVAAVEADAAKFFNGGNRSAGTRVRKGMQEIKSLAQEIRIEITETKNAK